MLEQIEVAKLCQKLQFIQLKMEGYKNPEIAAITKYSEGVCPHPVSIQYQERPFKRPISNI